MGRALHGSTISLSDRHAAPIGPGSSSYGVCEPYSPRASTEGEGESARVAVSRCGSERWVRGSTHAKRVCRICSTSPCATSTTMHRPGNSASSRSTTPHARSRTLVTGSDPNSVWVALTASCTHTSAYRLSGPPLRVPNERSRSSVSAHTAEAGTQDSQRAITAVWTACAVCQARLKSELTIATPSTPVESASAHTASAARRACWRPVSLRP
mmetsp:Transcript_6059/g.19389  ORF Transcript_6059/g.19389 Transcript_6059/m.19389 type:complete len:212 (+) Transcript_6059:148-783(+)